MVRLRRAAGAALVRTARAMPLVALLTAGCAAPPHPFEHEETSPLLSNPALLPVAVVPIGGAPGLAEAVSSALEAEDIAASPDADGPDVLYLRGTLEPADAPLRLHWRLLTPAGRTVGDVRQPLTAPLADTTRRSITATAAARAIAGLLRSRDDGVADLDARPRVTLRPVAASPGFDAIALTEAMRRALALGGLAVQADGTFVIDGTVRVIPGGGSDDVVEVSWTVHNRAGKELGTVAQGSPVPREQLLAHSAALAREIAEQGASGVAEVIRKSK